MVAVILKNQYIVIVVVNNLVVVAFFICVDVGLYNIQIAIKSNSMYMFI